MIDIRIVALIVGLIGIMYLIISINDHDMFRFTISVLFFILTGALYFDCTKEPKWNLLHVIGIILFVMGTIYLLISFYTHDTFRFIIAMLHYLLSFLLIWNPKFLRDERFK